MSDDFLERLREDARQLRYEPDDGVLWNRLRANIHAGIAVQANVPQLLARWFRPITASLLFLALVAALSVAWLQRPSDSGTSIESLSQNSVEISLDGDTFNLSQ